MNTRSTSLAASLLLLATLALVPPPSEAAPQSNRRPPRDDGSHQERLSKDQRRFQPVSVVPLPTDVDLSLPALPRGEQRLAGASWQIASAPDLVAPGGRLTLPVSGAAANIWVLQTAAAGDAIADWRAHVAESHLTHGPRPDYPVIGRYVLRYDDDSAAEVPLRWAEGVENGARRTFEPVSRFIGDLGWATIAWQGELDAERDLRPVAYATRVLNPRPERRLVGVEFVAATGNWGKLAVFAVRTDPVAPNTRCLVVAPDGDDANPGTLARPFATVQHAADTARPGDTVLLRGGDYRPKAPIVPPRGGEPDAWITYSGYPGETAILRGDLLYTDNGDAANPRGNSYTVRTAERTVELVASRTGAFTVFKCAWLRLQNLSVEDSHYCGIAVDAAHAAWMQKHDRDGQLSSHDIDILHTRVHRTVHAGIGVFANYNSVGPALPCRNIRVLGNQVLNAYDYELAMTTTGPGHQAETRAAMRGKRRPDGHANFGDENLDFHGVENLEVGHNEVFAGGKEGIDLMIGTRGARVHHNFIHENFVYLHFGGGKAGIYLDTRRGEWDLEIDHNVVRQGGAGIAVFNEDNKEGRDLRVHHNLCVDNRWTGITVGANPDPSGRPVHGVQVYSNTCYKDGYFDDNSGPAGSMQLFQSANLHDIVVRENLLVDGRDSALLLGDVPATKTANIRVERNLIWPASLAEPKEIRFRKGAWSRYNGADARVEDPCLIAPENWNFNPRPGSTAATQHLGAFPW